MGFTGISVLLPVFCPLHTSERLQSIERSIFSVLSQRCHLPLELILIDDGSPRPLVSQPSLSELLLGSSHVKYIRFSRNHGIVYALNFGLQSSNYDLIARVDSDDTWRPGKLEKQLQHFENDPQLTIMGTGMRRVFEDPRNNEDIIRPGTWEKILQFSGEVGCPFPHGSILARKSIFLLLGGYSHNPAVRHCEDFALWAVWLRFFKGDMIQEVLYDYSISDRTVSHHHARRQQLSSMEVRQQFKQLGNYEYIPGAMMHIAKWLGCSMIDAGKICFLAWHGFDLIAAEGTLLTWLKRLMPDRQVVDVSDAASVPFERILCFSKGDDFRRLKGRGVMNLSSLYGVLGEECLK